MHIHQHNMLRIMKNNNIVSLIFTILLFSSLGLAEAGQESIKLSKLYTISRSTISPQPGLAISVSDSDLIEVSTSVLKAETWLRNNVLSLYPSTPITTILLNPKTHYSLTLTSLQNLHHSLTRWDLDTHIKLSLSCSLSHSHQNKPILEFLKSKNTTCSIHPFSSTPRTIIEQNLKSLKSINILIPNNPERKFQSFQPQNDVVLDPRRKLESFSNTVPSTIEKHPQSPSESPQNDVVFDQTPTNAPSYQVGPTLAPCYNPAHSPSPSPHNYYGHPVGAPMGGALWCVAKPSVPTETLQAAMDYACGEGGADCEEIKENGNCYSPDTVVAHASYAFNAYWQKHKRNGGTCSFGATAMLINNDPSFLHCRFILT